MNFDFLTPKEKVAEILRRIYTFGMTTTSGGNISMRDEEGNIWITPGAVDKGNIRPRDIVYIDKDGHVEGLHPPSSELPFHLAIYQARPDIRSIIHAHSPILVSFSLIRRVPNTRIIPQAYQLCGKIGFAKYELPGSESLGLSISDEFSKGSDAVIMENHGTVVGGKTIQQTFARFETLEFCAKTETQAATIGNVYNLNDQQINRFNQREANAKSTFEHKDVGESELNLRGELIRIIRRAYQQKLIISTFGTFSARLGKNAFVITPTARDRYYLKREDLVLVKNGQSEKGKQPSRATEVHQQIYQDHPDINCIIFAQSPYATAYAVAQKQIDTHTIPESYVLLRELPIVKYGNQYRDGKEISVALSSQTPNILIENDSLLVTGDSILNTFDRLEVAEFSARSLTLAQQIGELNPIQDRHISELKEKFNLK